MTQMSNLSLVKRQPHSRKVKRWGYLNFYLFNRKRVTFTVLKLFSNSQMFFPSIVIFITYSDNRQQTAKTGTNLFNAGVFCILN